MSTSSPPPHPPEQSTLSYRLGRRSDFLREMLARLPWQTIPDGPHAGTRPLANLATHSERDPTVALLDAFAVVADVLTFYQERIANEGFLRTATETRSVLELAHALGYELGPGLAASTWLAFTVEEAAGAPPQVLIDPGVRVLSIPGQNERPQTFETVERLVARPEWNQLRPVTSQPQDFVLSAPELWLRGLQAGLTPGDQVLLVSHERESNGTSTAWELRTVAAVTQDTAAGRTLVTLVPKSSPPTTVPGGGTVYLMNQRMAAFGHNAPDWLTMPAAVQTQYVAVHGASADNTWPKFKLSLNNDRLFLDNLYPRLLPNSWLVLVAGSKVAPYWVKSVDTTSHTNYALTARLSAPTLSTHPGDSSAPSILDFENSRRALVVLGQGGELPLAERPLLNEGWGRGILAPFPDLRPELGPDALDEEDKITLERVVLGLPEGRTLVISGKRLRVRVLAEAFTLQATSGVTRTCVRGDVLFAVTWPIVSPEPTGSESPPQRWRLMDMAGFEGVVDLPYEAFTLEPAEAGDPVIAEVVTVKGLMQTQNPARTALRFTAPLKYWYDRSTVTLHGNVTTATHGETVREVLGSGNGSQANQRFTLRRTPLTWISAATSSGRRSTLEIRVDGILWHEVTSFHDEGPSSRVYRAQRDERGHVVVIFGDGVHGARLPTGQENVIATYRIGTGLERAVGAGKLTLFQTKPLGLRAVTNPLRATGAEAPDTGAVARREVPLSVLTLERIVSVTDYETFAQSFAGIGKARATFLRRGEVQRLHLSLALADGSPVPADAVILGGLRAAMDAVRETTTPVELAGYRRSWFRVAAVIRAAPDFLFADVAAAARAALTQAFSFERRAFGQGVAAAEVVALLQGIEGVDFVDLNGLAKSDPSMTSLPTTVEAWLSAEEARWTSAAPGALAFSTLSGLSDDILPAELLLLDPSSYGITLQNQEEPQP